ncbi:MULTISPECIES: hypothetical protein [unclassified Microbacterium]|uniref:hypothetical protein n=1 Tax=unclassified Microbacterium TaxID=2609290 RepID=UPI000928D785|nr:MULTISPECIES: hypothetical protein [unclassified Microbacterium]OJV81711.1 MAG: hypothetical protein BGO46_01750 [Microbacterium sp. 70-16]
MHDMRGGLERWKRGGDSRGIRQAIAYALKGTCDAHLQVGADALEAYAGASDTTVARFSIQDRVIVRDELSAGGLRVWLTGHDPITGEERGRQRLSEYLES